MSRTKWDAMRWRARSKTDDSGAVLHSNDIRSGGGTSTQDSTMQGNVFESMVVDEVA